MKNKNLEQLYSYIQEVYLSDSRPWIIGFSGGKDSTCTLQVVWHALRQLPSQKLKKNIYVVSSDTLVEMPLIRKYLKKMIKKINLAAADQDIPIKAHILTPSIENTFWVNLIGRGYPAPYSNFRWCTDRLKIRPTTQFIKDKVNISGEVLIVLGARISESSRRAGTMQEEKIITKRDAQNNEKTKKVGRKIIKKSISKHKDLPNAYIFTPIEDWSTDDVWEFLHTIPAPWGDNHKELIQLYRDAQEKVEQDEDKPFDVFGNSRFGCWCCTVVKVDKSMTAMLESGHTWMKPLLEFRDWLVTTQDPAKKSEIRSSRRRNGKVQFKVTNEGKKIIWGPYKLEFRKKILRKLLQTQKRICELAPEEEISLISDQELLKIRELWKFEEGDWSDSVPTIYHEELNKKLDVPKDDWSGMGETEYKILQEVCEKNNLPVLLLCELFDAERRVYGMSRRAGIYSSIDSIFRKDWRSEKEIFEEITSKIE